MERRAIVSRDVVQPCCSASLEVIGGAPVGVEAGAKLDPENVQIPTSPGRPAWVSHVKVLDQPSAELSNTVLPNSYLVFTHQALEGFKCFVEKVSLIF